MLDMANLGVLKLFSTRHGALNNYLLLDEMDG